MDQWVDLIENYSTNANLQDFSKVVQSAYEVLKEDLADFEIEWVLQSLFTEPVNLACVMAGRRGEDAWSRACADALILFAHIVHNYAKHLEPYVDDIIKVCMHPYQPYVRKRAVQCLSAVAASEHGALLQPYVPVLRDALRRHDETLSLRVPLAHLLGIISEFFPEIINDSEDLCRTYLAILEASKTTDSLIKGVVLGLTGLLKKFGNDLPVRDLNIFYEKLTSTYLQIDSCEEAALNFLEAHASLYPEMLRQDSQLRQRLWRVLEQGKRAAVTDTILAVYSALVPASTSLDDIIRDELYPRLQSQNTKVKNMAFKVLSVYVWRHRGKVSDQWANHFEKQVTHLTAKLEFDLERKAQYAETVQGDGNFDYELHTLMEQAAWSVTQGVSGSEALLQYLIVLWPRAAPAARRRFVLHPLLAAPDHIRAAAVAFLMSESAKGDDSLVTDNKYMRIWHDLFDSLNGKDQVVLQKSRLVFDEFISSVLLVMRTFVDKRRGSELELSEEKLSGLLLVAQRVMDIEHVEGWVADCANELLALALHLHRKGAAPDALVALIATLADKCDSLCMFEEGVVDNEICRDLKHFYKELSVERCTSEAQLCASCVALARAPLSLLPAARALLDALTVIFSRNDAEPELLRKALHKFENFLDNKNADKEYEEEIIAVMRAVRRVRDWSSWTGKEARVLRRTLTRFIGKYGDMNQQHTNDDFSSEVRIENKLTLKLPNKKEGVDYEVGLARVCEAALAAEDASSLRALLLLLCANPGEDTEWETGAGAGALAAVVRALCVCAGRGDGGTALPELQLALAALPDDTACLHTLTHYMCVESSPGVRRALGELAGCVLGAEPLAERTRRALDAAADRCQVLMATEHAGSVRAGVELCGGLAGALRDHNEAVREHAPPLLLRLLKTNCPDFASPYDLMLQHFNDKLVLIPDESLDRLIDQIVANLYDLEYSEAVYETIVKKSLETAKIVYDYRGFGFEDFVDALFRPSESSSDGNLQKEEFTNKWLHLSIGLKLLDLDAALFRKIVAHKDFFILKCVEKLIEKKNDVTALSLVFRALSAYADLFMEMQYQKTLELLSNIIVDITPKVLNKMYWLLEECICEYDKIWQTRRPQPILNSFEAWFKKIPLKLVTEDLQKKIFNSEHMYRVAAMKKMTNFLNTTTLYDERDKTVIKTWPKIVMQVYLSNARSNRKSKMAYLTDVMTVALFFSNDEEIKNVLREIFNLDNISAMEFFKNFVSAFAPFLLKTDILAHEELQPNLLPLIAGVVKYYTQNKNDNVCQDVVKKVNSHWPAILNGNPKELCELLLNLKIMNQNRGLTLNSSPGRWLLRALERAGAADAVQLMYGLACFSADDVDEDVATLLSAALKSYASKLPVRLSELEGRSEPRALAAPLHALAHAAAPQLLDLVMKLAAGDEATGWWDDAFEACAGELASRQDAALAARIYDFTLKRELAAPTVLRRMLLPLLRNSSSEFCEQFLSGRVGEILARLRRAPRAAPSEFALRACLTSYSAALMLLHLAFEKVSTSALELPTSALYASLGVDHTWYLVREACKLFDLHSRKTVLPDNASDDLKKCYRYFQCWNYVCAAAALERRRPPVAFYNQLFAPAVWRLIVDCDRRYVLHIDAPGRANSKMHVVWASGGGGDGAGGGAGSARTARTVRTRLFARTLSDDPLRYDYLEDDTAPLQSESHEVLVLRDNELNGHECAGALTALLRRLSAERARPPPSPLLNLSVALEAPDTHTNVNWFLAQMVCNCRAELKEYRELLTPALARALVRTPYTKPDKTKRYLNGLHVSVLNTILSWFETDCTELKDLIQEKELDETLSQAIELLVDTCVENRQLKYVMKTLTVLFNEVMNVFGKYVKVNWSQFDDYLKENDSTIHEVCVQLLITMAKNGVYVPQLLEAVTDRCEAAPSQRVPATAELLGLALSTCRSPALAERCLNKFWSSLKRLHPKNKHDYVRMLFYAQAGHAPACNEDNFRIVVDLAPKMYGTQKDKCHQIIAEYLASGAGEDRLDEVFETLEISEALGGEQAHVALNVVRGGMRRVRDSLRRRLVLLASGCCDSAVPKVRAAAYRVLLEAFRVMSENEIGEPHAKRRKLDIGDSPILKAYYRGGWYERSVLGRLGRALADRAPQLRGLVFDELQSALTKGDLKLRFCECFVILVLLTTSQSKEEGDGGTSTGGGARHQGGAGGGGGARDDAVRLASFVKLLLFDLMRDEFTKHKLRDKPLEPRGFGAEGGVVGTAFSRTYRGTLRTARPATRPLPPPRAAAAATSLATDVQQPVGDVLDTLLHFAENNYEASTAIFLEIFKCFLRENVDSFNTNMASLLCALLREVCADNRLGHLTPPALQMCRLAVDHLTKAEGFSSEAVEELKAAHRATEGADITRLLHEDVYLATASDGAFTFSEYMADDFAVDGVRGEFSLEELSGAFGSLSQWEELALSERRRRAAALPRLWTDHPSFERAFDDYTGTEGWLWALRCAWKRSGGGSHYRWLRDLERWGRREFAAGALLEAIDLHERWALGAAGTPPRADIAPAHCLAEWAARLMARRVVMSAMLEESEGEGGEEDEARALLGRTLRRHERAWAAAAVSRGLWPHALHCVNRNARYASEIRESELVEWEAEHAAAGRLRALHTAPPARALLERSLHKAETVLGQFGEQAAAGARLRLSGLVVRLIDHLQPSSTGKMEGILKCMDGIYAKLDEREARSGACAEMAAANHCALSCADRLWDSATDANSRAPLWNTMVTCAENLMKYDSGCGEMPLVVLLDKASRADADEAVRLTTDVLDLMSRSAYEFDEIVWDTLDIIRNKSPSAFDAYRSMLERFSSKNENARFYKMCLKLVRCTKNSLSQYCCSLRDFLQRNDAVGWNSTMEELFATLLEVAEGGLHYQLLRAYKNKLQPLRRFEPTEVFKKKAASVVADVLKDVERGGARAAVPLRELCPALAAPRPARPPRALEDALHIPRPLHIVKVDAQVALITSKQRPALLSVVLSDGRARRYLLKPGDARADAAAQRLQRCINRLAPYHTATYEVRALDADFGVIEFVEGCVTLRALIAAELPVRIDDLKRSVRDARVVELAAGARLALHRDLCRRAEPRALRRAVERRCSCVQEFLVCQRRYTDSLGAMTAAHYILGLGDRHLDNVLLERGGRALAVDWESVLEGALALPVPELLPARLTPQLLALAAGADLVRARLEAVLGAVRGGERALAAMARVAFLWHPHYHTQLFQNKLSRIQKKMSGEILSWESTRAGLAEGGGPQRDKYLTLLDACAPLGSAGPQHPSVEEQAAALLRHCTSAELLSATRAAWEPWL